LSACSARSTARSAWSRADVFEAASGTKQLGKTKRPGREAGAFALFSCLIA
jgi:hypothetical protein